jgi:elongation factor P
MPKASDVKRGDIVSIDGAPHMVESLNVSTPSARGGASLYRFRFRNLATKQKVDKTVKGDESFGDIDFSRRPVEFSYQEGDTLVFMDSEDYTEMRLNGDDLGDAASYITETTDGMRALVSDDRCIGIELPSAVTLQVVETGPAMKGASATARTKPATLSTGLVIQVPEYLESGEMVRVDTRTAEFLGRV